MYDVILLGGILIELLSRHKDEIVMMIIITPHHIQPMISFSVKFNL